MRRAYLGVSARPIELDRRVVVHHQLPRPSAAQVTEVQPDTAAARAGLRPGDMIVRAGEVWVASPDDLQRALGRHALGEPLLLEVLRGGDRVTVETLPSELPDA